MKKEKPWFNKFKKDWQNKKVLIMGLGVLGRGVADAKFFAQIGSQVTVTDLKKASQLKQSLDKLKNLSINFVLGEHRKEDILKTDLIVRNPAVPQNSPFLKIAHQHKIPITMDEALFSQYAPVKIVGITGTRGKSTTTTLIYQILKAAKLPVWLAGNLKDKAALPLLNEIEKDDWIVMELSSWQLQGFETVKASPHISVITNIYQDHLNRYQNMDSYIKDKKTIFKYQNKNDFLVLNQSSSVVKQFAQETKSKIVWFNKKDFSPKWKIKIKGEHNKMNIAAALKTGLILGIDEGIIKRVIGNFTGLAHRLEKVAKIDGVEYINDTTSTTPVAGIKALNSFKKPIILICGGASKNLEMSDFAQEIVKKAKKVILLEGTETDNLEKLIKELKGEKKIIARFNDLQKAVLKAKSLVQKGDLVLLSPGCASFGMFKNEFDRGEQFKKIVKSLS